MEITDRDDLELLHAALCALHGELQQSVELPARLPAYRRWSEERGLQEVPFVPDQFMADYKKLYDTVLASVCRLERQLSAEINAEAPEGKEADSAERHLALARTRCMGMADYELRATLREMNSFLETAVPGSELHMKALALCSAAKIECHRRGLRVH